MKCVIDQFAKEVTNYSSQYGSVGSISYAACNMIGKPWKFPAYGDFCESYSPRAYGKWWKICPSAIPIVEDKYQVSSTAEDFIDLVFESAVKPIRIDIYEIYHPGSVVRVWASMDGKKWYLLWSGLPIVQPAEARIFSPPITQIDRFINMLRIEFDQSQHEYYIGYDAIVMVGITHPTVFHPNSISSSLQNFGLLDSLICEEKVLAGVEFLLSKDLMKSIESSSSEDFVEEEVPHRHEEKGTRVFDGKKEEPSLIETQEALEGGYFSMLPEELIFHILKQVGIQSLCRLACTCKALNVHISEPLLYQHLNLKNCWWLVNNQTLAWLMTKCSKLKCLDLSWCGSYDAITSQCFMEFIQESHCDLNILCLNNCPFIESYCLYIIANNCPSLQVLSLYGCNMIDQLGFGELKKLRQLTHLDLSRTKIHFRSLHVLLQHLSNLKHIFLNYCDLDFDEVAVTLSTFNPKLISVGGWKCRNLTSRGLRALSKIESLQELDLGWALSGTITEGLGELLQRCVDLRKLFMTSLRTLYDQDLDLLAKFGCKLEQLDLTGTTYITFDAVTKLLRACSCLQLLDLSYCEHIHSTHVHQWKNEFPRVAIKGGVKQRVFLN